VYPKCVKTHLRAFVISKFFPKVIPSDPRFKGRGGRGGVGGEGRGEEGKDWALLVFGPFRRPCLVDS
jgi:hypothetical protein